jgi:hypothetical protein
VSNHGGNREQDTESMTTKQDELEVISLSHRPLRDTTRELLEHATAGSRGYVVSCDAAAEFSARAASLLAQRAQPSGDTSVPRPQLAIVSDTNPRAPAVLVTSSEQARRLSAVQLEQRLLGKTGLLVARTLAAHAHLLDAPGEGCDEAFMLGASGTDPRRSQLQTFGEAVAELMNWPILDSVELPMAPAQWRELVNTRPHAEVRERADVLGVLPDWDIQHARTPDGFYPVRAGIDYAIARSLAAAPHADVVWLVAPSADLNDARRYAEAIHARHPNKLLAYELDRPAAEALASLGTEKVQHFAATIREHGFNLLALHEGSSAARLLGDCVHLVP